MPFRIGGKYYHHGFLFCEAKQNKLSFKDLYPHFHDNNS